jgi:hypothetical protein
MRRILTTLLAPLLLSTTVAGGCYLITGPSLDLFIGSLLLVALLTPPLALASDSIGTIFAIILGAIIIWLIPTLDHAITFTQWFSCTSILFATVFAFTAIARLFIRLRVTPILASALTTILTLSWLTWPVWASPRLAGVRVSLPVRLHPLFTLNAACNNLGVWTEQRVAYHLTNLGQDAIYQLPPSIFPAVAFHLGIAVLAMSVMRAMNQWGISRCKPAGV